MAGKEGGGGRPPEGLVERLGRLLEDEVALLEEEGRGAPDRIKRIGMLARTVRELAMTRRAEAALDEARARVRMQRARLAASYAQARQARIEATRGDQEAGRGADDDDISDADLETLPVEVVRRAELFGAATARSGMVGHAELRAAPG